MTVDGDDLMLKGTGRAVISFLYNLFILLHFLHLFHLLSQDIIVPVSLTLRRVFAARGFTRHDGATMVGRMPVIVAFHLIIMIVLLLVRMMLKLLLAHLLQLVVLMVIVMGQASVLIRSHMFGWLLVYSSPVRLLVLVRRSRMMVIVKVINDGQIPAMIVRRAFARRAR